MMQLERASEPFGHLSNFAQWPLALFLYRPKSVIMSDQYNKRDISAKESETANKVDD